MLVIIGLLAAGGGAFTLMIAELDHARGFRLPAGNGL